MKKKLYENPSMKVLKLQFCTALMQSSRGDYAAGGHFDWGNSNVEGDRSDYSSGGDSEWDE